MYNNPEKGRRSDRTSPFFRIVQPLETSIQSKETQAFRLKSIGSCCVKLQSLEFHTRFLREKPYELKNLPNNHPRQYDKPYPNILAKDLTVNQLRNIRIPQLTVLQKPQNCRRTNCHPKTNVQVQINSHCC